MKEKRGNFILGELKTAGVVDEEMNIDRVKVQAEQEHMPANQKTRFARQFTIDQSMVSHQITNIWIEDGYIYGDVKVFDTPCGELLKTLLPQSEEDCQKTDDELGVMFGLRSVADMDQAHVVHACQIVTFDAIYKPERATH